jgi:hypothetical protein
MEITREKLFDEVWATPITHLCKAYGLSDQGLRKVCAKLQVPVPQRGHWTKIAAGHVIAKPILPPLQTKVRQSTGHTKGSMPPIDDMVNGHGLTDVVLPSPSLPGPLHSALTVFFQMYEQAEVDARQLHAKFLWESKHPGKRYTGKAPSFGSWQYFCDAGKILLPTHKKSFMRVSIGTYTRAFQLMHELITRLQTAGFEASIPEGRERLQAKRGSAILNIKVAEKLDVGHRREINSWTKDPRLVRTLTPTGRLNMTIEQMGLGETLISDSTKEPIESQWEKVMSAIEYRHAQSLMKVAEWAQSKRDYEDRERERQETLRLQEEERRADEAEQARRQALLQEVRDWYEADLLRAYLGHLDSRRSAGGVPFDGYESWAVWARQVAAALDRSERRVATATDKLDASPHP